MSEKEIFVLFANALLDAIPESKSFKSCHMYIKRQPRHVGMSAEMFDMDGNSYGLDPEFGYYDTIQELYTITQTQPPIHKDWNRAVFTLYPDGKVNMEYIFDAEWQAEVDADAAKANAKIRAAQKARETRLAKKTFFERGYRMNIGYSPRFVVIKGVEHIPFYSSDVVIDCSNMMKYFNLFKEKDKKEFFEQVKSNPFVDGIHLGSGSLMYDLSYDEYERDIEKTRYYAILNHKSSYEFIWPFHKVRKSEVESFYQCSLSIVIGGVEISKFDDAEVGYYGYPDKYPGYIDVSASGREKEIVSALPQEELKKISVGNPHEGFTYPTLIPNKFIEKIIFRRKHLNIDLVEEGEDSQEFTGKEDVFEVDPNHPDQKVLDMMEKYKVIEMKKKR
ncbi:MAG: hypothetical protein IJ263_08140 [Paludibacteraceae bacterium]|nr:hypothetical protein [Paludibacteraceae bacterium]